MYCNLYTVYGRVTVLFRLYFLRHVRGGEWACNVYANHTQHLIIQRRHFHADAPQNTDISDHISREMQSRDTRWSASMEGPLAAAASTYIDSTRSYLIFARRVTGSDGHLQRRPSSDGLLFRRPSFQTANFRRPSSWRSCRAACSPRS